ncbi:MAG: hypothetical protein J5851_02795 [Oscillospiraceae bacterium]|nr:hypothetical protein [Oscillospiraceae bacterium]
MPRARGTIAGTPRERSKGVVSTIIALILWIVSCVGIWLITKYQLEHNVYKLLQVVEKMGRDVVYETGKELMNVPSITPESLSEATKEIVNKLCLYRTLILGILELLLMIWPMLEYWFKFHNPRGLRDNYKWYVPVVIMCIVSLITIVIADAILVAFGWITLLTFAVILAVIFIPRLVPSLRPR